MTRKGLEWRGRRTKKEGEEKSLAGRKTLNKALIITFFYCTAGKIKICGEERLVLQEQKLWSQNSFFLYADFIFSSSPSPLPNYLPMKTGWETSPKGS